MRETDLDSDPLVQFRRWYDDAVAAGVRQPDAMALATVNADGAPTVRDRAVARPRPPRASRSTRTSRAPRPPISARSLGQRSCSTGAKSSVRCGSSASRAGSPDAEAVRYWDTRPWGHRISAWASPQSAVVDEATLAARVAEIEARFAGVDPPLPPFWGGFVVRPDEIELWQGATDRLHDRIRYCRESGEWKRTRPAP